MPITESKPLTLGLCGAHRTGKTTLAAALAARLGLPFARTSTGAVFARHGLDPAQVLDFPARLRIQHAVLSDAETVWRAHPGGFVCDRTPLDFIAYTLADIQGATPVDAAALEAYVERCFRVCGAVFQRLALVQPGLPLVYEPGKAALNPAYIEHLNSLMLGLAHDERLDCPVQVLPRTLLALPERVEAVLAGRGK